MRIGREILCLPYAGFFFFFLLFDWKVVKLWLWPCEGLRPTSLAGTHGGALVQLTIYSYFIYFCRLGGNTIHHSPSVNPGLPASMRGWLASNYIVQCLNTVILQMNFSVLFFYIFFLLFVVAGNCGGFFMVAGHFKPFLGQKTATSGRAKSLKIPFSFILGRKQFSSCSRHNTESLCLNILLEVSLSGAAGC